MYNKSKRVKAGKDKRVYSGTVSKVHPLNRTQMRHIGGFRK